MAKGADGAFGPLLRRQRRAAGLTQEELAARAGLSARGIADLERGARRTPRRETLELLVRALAASPEDEAALLAAARRPQAPIAQPTAAAASGAETAPRERARHNLPAQLTRLLGRDEAVRAAVGLARRAEVRLVTLTGPGGVGKTRLAIEVAAELLDDFTDGVWLVRLSHLDDPALVMPAIAETLSLQETAGHSLAETVRSHLRERRLLLVLDNCEHVAAAASEVVDLLQTSPALKVLATSRAPLRVQGEHECPVAPLAVPPTVLGTGPDVAHAPEHLTEYPAAALFVERARAVRPDFALTAANARAVAAICTRLDGLPLAIELAAARSKMLPPAALLAGLERGLGVLAGNWRDVVARQQAMRSALAWSEDLLSAEERVLFRRLAVFVGGCTLQAVEAVCGAPAGVEPLAMDALEGVSALVDQSLVQQREKGEDGDEPRFGMLHVIREYALERLEANGEAEALRRAHAAWLLALAERTEPELTGPAAAVWLGRLEREHDNIRAALGWARERGETETSLRLVAAVFRFWVVRGHLREGRAWAERLLALEPADGARAGDGAFGVAYASTAAVRARALRAAGVLALYQADEAAAGVWLEQAVALGQAAGDLQTAAQALNSLGVTSMHQGGLERAGVQLEESLALLRAVGEPRGIAVALGNLGLVFYFQGALERAAAAETEALALGRQVGDRDFVATTLANLASVAMRRGEVAQAEDLGREALALYRDLGDPRRCAVGLEGLASSAGMAGQGKRAARLLGAAKALRETLGTPNAAHERAEVEQAVAAARAALGEEAWAAALADGHALSLEEAVEEALASAQ